MGILSCITKQLMKLQLLFVVAMMMGLAYSESCCRHESGVRCIGDKCDLVSDEELAECTEDCPLKGCDPMTLLQCGGTLFHCGTVCLKQPIFPPSQECISCFGDLFQKCFKCLQP